MANNICHPSIDLSLRSFFTNEDLKISSKMGIVFSAAIVTDYLGSVRLIVSSTGVVSEVMEHDEFGRILQDTKPGLISFGFAGGLYDYKTSLVRF